jgi:hypothetical protein
LLDVHFEERVGQVAPSDQSATSRTAALLVAEDDDRPAPGALDRFDRGDDAERAVELPALRHRVEMGPRPDPPLSGDCPRTGPEEVARFVHLDLEAGLLEPDPGEVVRRVLLRRVADPVRARTLADRVQPVQPLESARGYSPNGLIGFGLVCTITLFVSR